MTVAAMFNFL